MLCVCVGVGGGFDGGGGVWCLLWCIGLIVGLFDCVICWVVVCCLVGVVFDFVVCDCN